MSHSRGVQNHQQQQPQKNNLSHGVSPRNQDPQHHHIELNLINPMQSNQNRQEMGGLISALQSTDELSKWGGNTFQQQPHERSNSKVIIFSTDPINIGVQRIKSKVMSQSPSKDPEIDSDLSEGLDGYVETQSIGVGIDSGLPVTGVTEQTKNSRLSENRPEDQKTEAENASLAISQTLEQMRHEEEQRRNNRNGGAIDFGIGNQDSLRMSEISSPRASINHPLVRFQQKRQNQTPWSLYLYQPPFDNQQEEVTMTKTKFYQLHRFNNKKMPVLRQGQMVSPTSPGGRLNSVQTDRSNQERISLQFDQNNTPFIVPVIEESIQDSIFYGQCNINPAKNNSTAKKEMKYHQIQLELPFTMPEKEYLESGHNQRRKIFSRKQMSQVSDKHDSMPLSLNQSNIPTVAEEDSPQRGITGVKATLQNKSRSPSMNKRNGQNPAEQGRTLIPPLFMLENLANATKHKEELFIVDDENGTKEDNVETFRRSFDKNSSIVMRAAATIIDYTSVLRDQIQSKNSDRNTNTNLNRATSNKNKSHLKSKENHAQSFSPKSLKNRITVPQALKTVVLSNHHMNPFNNLTMTLKMKQFQLCNLNNTMIQQMDLSNKNSSAEEFHLSKDAITLDDLTFRESVSGEQDFGNEEQGNTPKHMLLMNQQILVKDQIINNAFKAGQRKMPFAHFQLKVPHENIKPHKPVKNNIVVVGTQSPRPQPDNPSHQKINQGTSGVNVIPEGIQIIRQQARPKGVDRSMQMSVSFGGAFTQVGSASVNQSQITVGDQRIGTANKPKSSEKSRQGSRGRQNFQIKTSSHIKDEGEKAQTNSDSPSKQFKLRSGSRYDLTIVQEQQYPTNPFTPDPNSILKPDSAEITFNYDDKQTKSAQSKHRKNVFQQRVSTGSATPKLGSQNGEQNEKADLQTLDHQKYQPGRNYLNVQSIKEEETKKTFQSSIAQNYDKTLGQTKLTKVQKELKVVRHIYDNFEKHQLPICDPKARLKNYEFKMSPYNSENPDILNQAKESLLQERYKKFQGKKYMQKEGFYRGDNENGFQSGELRKKNDNEEYYTMRAEFNKQRYLEMISRKLMENDVSNKPQQSPRVIPKKQAQTPQPMNQTQITFKQQTTTGNVSTMRDTYYSNPAVDQFRSTQTSFIQTMTPDQNDYTQLSGDYNRFAHLLQFKNDQKIKRADVMNTDRNEALQKIREKIRNRATQGVTPNIENTTQQNFNRAVLLSLEETTPRYHRQPSPHVKAKTSMNLKSKMNDEAYIDYLANKTTLLPLLNQQINLLKLDEDLSRKLSNTQQNWKKRSTSDGRVHTNTLLHMKLQPKLRMTDFDFTKEKLDMKVAKEVKRRNKKEEHVRLMKNGGHNNEEAQDSQDTYCRQNTVSAVDSTQRSTSMTIKNSKQPGGPLVQIIDEKQQQQQQQHFQLGNPANREFTMSLMNVIADQLI